MLKPLPNSAAVLVVALVGAGCSAPDSGAGEHSTGGGVAGAGGADPGGGGAGGKAGDSGDDWTACQTVTPVLSRETRFHLVLDCSESMAEPAGGSRSKWDVVREVVGSFVEALPASDGAGVMPFPNRATVEGVETAPTSICVDIDKDIVAVELGTLGSEQRMKITEALAATTTGGASATVDACMRAHGDADVVGIGAEREAVVLITDGHPTMAAGCIGDGSDATPVDAARIVDEFDRGYVFGEVLSFAIGLPGTEVEVGNAGSAREWLSQAAVAGGTAAEGCDAGLESCHVDLSDVDDLSAALAAALEVIANQTASCRFGLPTVPPDADLDREKVRVLFTPSDGAEESLAHDTTAGCDEGFRYVAEGHEIALCPGTCARLRADADAELTLEFGCSY